MAYEMPRGDCGETSHGHKTVRGPTYILMEENHSFGEKEGEMWLD